MAWPFVGRAHDVERVRTLLVEHGGVALLGPAGIGKSRLSEEVTSTHATVRVLGEEGAADDPLGPFRSVLPPGPRPSDDEVVAIVLQQLHDTSTPDVPAVLLVDDAHLLHRTALGVVVRVRDAGARVLLTARQGEADHGLARLWQRDSVVRVAVGPLDREDCDALVRTVLDGPVGQFVLDELWRLSQGHALHLHELVVDALERGSVRRDGGRWTLDPPLTPSPRLAELVGARLRRPSREAREALELVAYAQPVSLDTLEALVDAAVLDQLDGADLLEVSRTAQGRTLVRLSHPLYAEVLRASTSALRRRRIARGLADIEPARGVDDDELLHRARLHLDAGRDEPELFVAAGRLAYGLRDHDTALRLGRAARTAGATYDGTILVAVAATELGLVDEARTAYLAAHDVAPATGERTWVDVGLAYLEALRLGRVDVGRALLAGARAGAAGPVAHDVDAWSALLDVLDRQPSDVTARADDVLGVAADQPRAATVAGTALALAATESLDAVATARGVAAVRRWRDDRAAQRALPCAVDLVDVLEVRTLALHEGLVPARRVAAGHRAAASRSGLPEAVGLATWSHGWLALQRGSVDDAIAALQDAATLLESHVPQLAAPAVRADLALALVWAGRRSEAAALLGRSTADERQPAVHARRRAVELLLDDGSDAATTGAALGRLAEALSGDGLPAAALDAWALALQLGAPVPPPAGLRAVGTARPSWLLRCARQAAALQRQDLLGLERVVAEHRRDGRLLAAAATATRAAEVARRGGDVAAADRLDVHARALVERCPGAVLPAGTPAVADALTRREAQVARLVADGSSNRQVAEVLGLSPRTVEAHLSAAYAKLGLRGRGELAELLAVDRPERDSGRGTAPG